jgi:hypothetical protein
LNEEIRAGIAKRQLNETFARWQGYARGRVDSTAGKNTGSELTGNCRINWYTHLMHNVLAAPMEAERFTHELHRGALGGRDGFAYLMAIAAQKMDLTPRKAKTFADAESPEQALEILKQALSDASVAYAAAIAPLTKSQIRDLETNINPVFLGQNQVGHTLNDRYNGRRLCDTMEMMDRDALQAAADALIPLSDEGLLDQFKNLDLNGSVQVPGATGKVVGKIETPCGTIVIGGKGTNTYQLDKIPNLCAVVDLGGNDTYIDGTVGTFRPVLTVLDLTGNDVYRSGKPGVQGSAILGVSMLLDREGDDVYEAQDMAQASAIAGVGILIDYKGNDTYKAFRRAQGHALCGLGVLIDKDGSDDYRAALWGQGVGNPLGFALLDDLKGNDHYFCGGQWRDSYPETPGCEGWGQGVGGGIRQVASGGIGVILDGAGDDVYEFDYLSHGGGYWCGLGFARDFGGNDQRLITRKAYDGGPRQEPVFQRFGCGWGCHYSLGYCFDDSGDDVYEGTIMGTGMAWDCAAGGLCDFAGNDRYKSTGGLTQGTSQQMGFGILYEYDGEDVYEGYGQGYAATGQTYHPMPDCGGNFAFLVDYGGSDKYGSGAQNNSYLQRGMQSGYLIDRPRQDEIQPTAEKPKPPTDSKNGQNRITARKTALTSDDSLVLPTAEEEAADSDALKPNKDENTDSAATETTGDAANDQAEVKPAAPPKPKHKLTKAQAALREQVRKTLASYLQQPFGTRQNTAGEIMDFCLPFGCSTEISLYDASSGERRVNGITCLCWNFPCYDYQPLTLNSGHIAARLGYGVQSQPSQLLATLAFARVQANYPLRAGSATRTVADLIESEKLACRAGSDLSLKLVGLSYYAEDGDWKNDQGEDWSVEKIVREELNRTMNGSNDAGMNRLLGLAYANYRREKRDLPLEGQYARADKYLKEFHKYAFNLQNADGSWGYFLGARGENRDPASELRSTAYVLEWLALSLGDDHLSDDRVGAAVADVVKGLNTQRNLGSMPNLPAREINTIARALHALAIYDDRFYKTAEEDKPAPEKTAAPQRPQNSR